MGSLIENSNSIGNFWELSNEILQRIKSHNYLENKLTHNGYLKLKLRKSVWIFTDSLKLNCNQ